MPLSELVEQKPIKLCGKYTAISISKESEEQGTRNAASFKILLLSMCRTDYTSKKH